MHVQVVQKRARTELKCCQNEEHTKKATSNKKVTREWQYASKINLRPSDHRGKTAAQSWWCNKERGTACNMTVRMRAQPKADFMRWNWIGVPQYVRQQTYVFDSDLKNIIMGV